MILPKKNALDIMKQHGAQVDYDRKICRFPRTLVEEFIKKSPTKFVFGARNSKNKLAFEKGKTHPLLMGNLGATYVTDLETRERRLGTLRDVEEFNKVTDGLENTFFGGSESVTPSDVPPHLAQYYSWIAAFKNTSKHLILYESGSQAVKVAVEMASAILGDEQKLKDNPIISFFACAPSVLGIEEKLLDGIMASARFGLPLVANSGPASGATGPGTLAGTLALSNAEVLGTITLVQILNPGTPVTYCTYARTFDMRAENVSLASPEFLLLRICQGQLARYYNLPSTASGLSSDSKLLDVQSGYDKSIGLISILSGAADLLTSDSIDGGDLADLAELVVNDEMMAAYLRVIKGIEVNERTLAIEEIERIGPGLGNNFLDSKFTLQNFRKETWLDYKITERRKWVIWNRDGAKSAEAKAIDRAKEILKNHEPEPLQSDVEKELHLIVDRVRTSQ
jgi:trimethylamine--corrinoid protein Co-methyltransferase